MARDMIYVVLIICDIMAMLWLLQVGFTYIPTIIGWRSVLLTIISSSWVFLSNLSVSSQAYSSWLKEIHNDLNIVRFFFYIFATLGLFQGALYLPKNKEPTVWLNENTTVFIGILNVLLLAGFIVFRYG